MTLRWFHPPPLVGFFLLLALGVAEYKTGDYPAHAPGFLWAYIAARPPPRQRPAFGFGLGIVGAGVVDGVNGVSFARI